MHAMSNQELNVTTNQGRVVNDSCLGMTSAHDENCGDF